VANQLGPYRSDKLLGRGAVDPRRAVGMLRQVASALDAAHRAGRRRGLRVAPVRARPLPAAPSERGATGSSGRRGPGRLPEHGQDPEARYQSAGEQAADAEPRSTRWQALGADPPLRRRPTTNPPSGPRRSTSSRPLRRPAPVRGRLRSGHRRRATRRRRWPRFGGGAWRLRPRSSSVARPRRPRRAISRSRARALPAPGRSPTDFRRPGCAAAQVLAARGVVDVSAVSGATEGIYRRSRQLTVRPRRPFAERVRAVASDAVLANRSDAARLRRAADAAGTARPGWTRQPTSARALSTRRRPSIRRSRPATSPSPETTLGELARGRDPPVQRRHRQVLRDLPELERPAERTA